MIRRTKKIARMAIIMTVLLVGVSSLIYAEYNRDRVVEVMRNNVALLGATGKAAQSEEWELAAQKLFELAQGMIDIRRFDPPRGSKEDWEGTMTEVINAAFIGIGACGTRDADALQASIGTLRQLNRQGHGDHKPK